MELHSVPGSGGLVSLDVARVREALCGFLVARLELAEEDALPVVGHLIRSEQAGKSSHGLVRAAYMATSGKFGPYGKRPAPQPERPGPGRLRVDGSGHLGYAVLAKLIDAGCREATAHGLCTATGAFVYPSGALGDWARVAAERKVGMVFVASSPRRVAPLGQTKPVVGTNALCIAMPTQPLPFVADAATSAIPHGALLVARVNGSPLPPNSAVNSRGEPTTLAEEVDPTKGKGALLPFGASYKAFAFAMGIELLACLGGGIPGEIQAGRHGVFCLFLGPQMLADRLPLLSDWLQQSDGDGTRIPGWISGSRARDQQGRGIVSVLPNTFRKLAELGALPDNSVVEAPGAEQP